MQTSKSFKWYTAIITLGGFIIFLFQTALSMDIVNVILPTIETTRGWSRSELNSALSIATLAGIITPVVLGTAFLKFGLKRTLMASILVTGLSTVVMGLTDSMAVFTVCMFLVQFICMALTFGLIGIIGNWFLTTKGRILGIVTIAAPFSTAFFTPATTWLLNVAGFTMMFVIIGVVWLALGVGFLLLMPARPEDVGFHLDNGSAPLVVAEEKVSHWTPKAILKKKEAWLLIFGFGCVYLMSTSIMSQFVAYMTDQGLSSEMALFVLSAASIAGMPFSYLWGWLDDKISTPITSGIFLLSFVVASGAMVFASGDNLVCTFIAGFAVAATTGGMPNLIPSCISWVFGGNEYINVNRTIGLFHLGSRSLAFALMSATLTVFGSYTIAFVAFIPLAVLAAFALFSIKRSYDPNNAAYKD